MGAKTEQILGHAKQVLGAFTGRKKMKHEGSARRTKASSRAGSTQPSTRHMTHLRT